MEKWSEIKKELFAKEGNKCRICEKEANTNGNRILENMTLKSIFKSKVL